MLEPAAHFGVTCDLARSESQNSSAMSVSRDGWNFGEGQAINPVADGSRTSQARNGPSRNGF